MDNNKLKSIIVVIFMISSIFIFLPNVITQVEAYSAPANNWWQFSYSYSYEIGPYIYDIKYDPDGNNNGYLFVIDYLNVPWLDVKSGNGDVCELHDHYPDEIGATNWGKELDSYK